MTAELWSFDEFVAVGLGTPDKMRYAEGMVHAATGIAGSRAFPNPDHDHNRCSDDAMTVAQARCLARGQRLTAIRRQVLAALLDSHKALGAYDIIERLFQKGLRLAPITAYRALEFLQENGLVHRIASRNAFIACVHNHDAEGPVVFMICEGCGVIGEASSPDVTATLAAAAQRADFRPKSPVIEITGICAHCVRTPERAGQRTD